MSLQQTLCFTAIGLCAVGLLCAIRRVDGFPAEGGSSSNCDLWTPPDGRTREEWLACNGLPADSCRRMPDKMRTLTQFFYGPDYKSSTVNDTTLNTPDGCILLTEDQIDEKIRKLQLEKSSSNVHGRQKRKAMDFGEYSADKWNLPIVYKFDGMHTEAERRIIRDAIQLVESNTCLRFEEITTCSSYKNNHIIFTKQDSCSSYVGRVSIIPQPVDLAEGCLSTYSVPGTPVHEIGHAVGLFHEHQRTDRDSHVLVLQENIIPEKYSTNYNKEKSLDFVPYHFGSVMHYADGDFATDSDLHTIQSIEPLYQLNMGQRCELSGSDAHAINIAYDCYNVMCSSCAPIDCQRGGCRDPNNCGRCKCPAGFGGNFCERVADPVNAVCGGTFDLNSTDQLTIKSPGYDIPGYYNNSQECSWLVKNSGNLTLRLQFVGNFSIMYSEKGCHWHWVEVKFKSDLGLEGGRFCGSTAPKAIITSEWSEMLIIFKTNFNYSYTYIRGFQATVTTGDPVRISGPTTTITCTATSQLMSGYLLQLLLLLIGLLSMTFN